VKTFC